MDILYNIAPDGYTRTIARGAMIDSSLSLIPSFYTTANHMVLKAFTRDDSEWDSPNIWYVFTLTIRNSNWAE